MELSNTPYEPSEPDVFADFLTEASNQAAIKRLNSEYIQHSIATVNNALRAHEVANFVFADGSRNETLIEDVAHVIAEDALINQGLPQDSEETQSRINHCVAMRSISEHALYAQIGILRAAGAVQPLTLEQTERLDTSKANLVANWLLDQDLQPTSAWVSFLNEVVPGRELEAQDINAALIRVIDAKSEKNDQKLQNDFARMVARNNSNLDSVFETEPELEFELYTLALHIPYLTEANAEEKIVQQAHKLNTSVENIRTYIAAITAQQDIKK